MLITYIFNDYNRIEPKSQPKKRQFIRFDISKELKIRLTAKKFADIIMCQIMYIIYGAQYVDF